LENLNFLKNKINKNEKIFTSKSSFHVVLFLFCSSIILNVLGLGHVSFLVTGSTDEQICCVDDDGAGVWELNGFLFLFFYLIN